MGVDDLGGVLAAERVRQQQSIIEQVLDLVKFFFVGRIVPPFDLDGHEQLSYGLGHRLLMGVIPQALIGGCQVCCELLRCLASAVLFLLFLPGKQLLGLVLAYFRV